MGIGVGLGSRPRADIAARRSGPAGRAARAGRGDLSGNAQPGPVTGGWLRMGGTGAPPAAGNMLLAGDAAGLINPLQGEGIGPAMVSARLAAEAVLAGPARAGPAYTEAIEAAFGRYMAGAVSRAVRAAAQAQGHVGCYPPAHRPGRAPRCRRHLVDLLERPGGRRPPSPLRLDRARRAGTGRPPRRPQPLPSAHHAPGATASPRRTPQLTRRSAAPPGCPGPGGPPPGGPGLRGDRAPGGAGPRRRREPRADHGGQRAGHLACAAGRESRGRGPGDQLFQRAGVRDRRGRAASRLLPRR